MTWKILLFLMPFFVFSCSGEVSNDSPEVVVGSYVQMVKSNQLEKAKAFCTPAASAYLDALAAVITATDTTMETGQIKIESIKCTLSDDQLHADCIGQFDDGFERYTEKFVLTWQEGFWLIDHQPETGTLRSSEETLTTEDNQQNE